MSNFFRKIYYTLKPFIPRRLQIAMRRRAALRKLEKFRHIWPIDESAGRQPDCWSGWPEGKRFALVLTHDVETARGQERCHELAEMEERLGFRSSFNFVAETFPVSHNLRFDLEKRGFEIGVHGLTHDGSLYESQQSFKEQATRINRYLRGWNAAGFRSPSMYHNLEWLHDLHIEYDASTFDTDPFEPQPDSMGTIFPFWVSRNGSQSGYVELPYTLPQDFTLFVIFQERNSDIWKRKLDWIAERGGMALLITHPDYITFDGTQPGLEEYPARYYEEFLNYVKTRYGDQYWNALPKDVTKFWKRFI